MSNREIHNENRADQLNEDLLWGAPRSSDGAFLVSVRSRLNYQVSGLWLSTRNSFAIVGAAAVLLLGVWLPGQNSSQRISQEISDATLNTAVDEFVVDEVDPLDLADYLGVQSNEAEVTNEEAEPTTESDQTVTVTDVSTDEILELNEQDFDLVIAEIQETEFF
ncbi:MAG: hypothetical protein IPP40_01490 [bacterium]|nr:hypothetical protein [bacterium]